MTMLYACVRLGLQGTGTVDRTRAQSTMIDYKTETDSTMSGHGIVTMLDCTTRFHGNYAGLHNTVPWKEPYARRDDAITGLGLES